MWTIYFPDGEVISDLLALEAVSVSFTHLGGCDVAEFNAVGTLEEQQFCTDWLGRKVQFLNEFGVPVWHGYIVACDVGAGGWTVGKSLESIANRVAVEYSVDNPDGSSYAITAWLDDTTSQNLYGVREQILSLGEAGLDEALARQKTHLSGSKLPVVTRSRSGGEQKTVLLCWGAARFLEWKYYQYLEGRIENVGDKVARMSIGWQFTSDEVGVYGAFLHSLQGKLEGLAVGDRIELLNMNHNNGTHYVTSAAEKPPQSVTGTTISFLSNDDIYDSADGFKGFEADSFVKVTGSLSNDGYHAIDGKKDDGYLTTEQNFTNAVVNESAGRSITVTQFQKLELKDSVLTRELPGETATIRLVGFQVAQSFMTSSAMNLHKVAISIGAIGNPSDFLQVQLWTDSDGPSVWVDTASIEGSFLSEEPEWTWLYWGEQYAVQANTKYWLIIARYGETENPDRYYPLTLAEGAYGDTWAWNNTSWTPITWLASPAVNVPFKLWSSEDTSVSLTRIISQCGGRFVTACSAVVTGVIRNSYTDNGARGDHEFLNLLETGTVSGASLGFEVDSAGCARIFTMPSVPSDSVLPEVRGDGQIYDLSGRRWMSGETPVAQYFHLLLPDSIGSQWNISPAVVLGAAYNVAAGTWDLEFSDINQLSTYKGK